METTMRPTYATTYLIFSLLLSHIYSSAAVFSSLANLAKGAVSGLANALGLTPQKIILSSDPNIALKQLPDILKQRKLQEVEVNLDEALKSEAPKIYNEVGRELKAKLPRRTEPLV